MGPMILVALLAFIQAAPVFAQTSDEPALRCLGAQSGAGTLKIDTAVLYHIDHGDYYGALRSRDRAKAAAARECVLVTLSNLSVRRASLMVQQEPRERRSWVRRHPVLFGTLVGFAGGFLIGYLPGDDAWFDDFAAPSSGLVMGGAGAGIGAAAGAILAR
jgi:hypothetical protein